MPLHPPVLQRHPNLAAGPAGQKTIKEILESWRADFPAEKITDAELEVCVQLGLSPAAFLRMRDEAELLEEQLPQPEVKVAAAVARTAPAAAAVQSSSA